MRRSLKTLGMSSLVLLCVVVSVIWMSSLHSASAQSASTPPSPKTVTIPRQTKAMGPYTVKGNAIFGVDGKRYYFHGVGRDGLEFSCWGDGHLTPKELSYIGPGTSNSTVTYWGANVVRLPISEGFWLNGQPSAHCSAAQYRQVVQQTIATLTALHLNVMLDLQWTDAGGHSLAGGGAWAMPDADSVTFWKQAATLYKGYSNVQFELFNEPHPAAWSCWNGPCTMTHDTGYSNDCGCAKVETYQSVGMQALLNTVRSTGATNLAIVGGMEWGFDLSQIAHYAIKGTNVVYDTHPYPYGDKQPQTWNAAFGNISATYPVISAESGEYDCGTGFMSQLLAYYDAHQIGWVAWAWTVQGDACGYPLLIKNYNGTPSQKMGQLIYQHLQSYK